MILRIPRDLAAPLRVLGLALAVSVELGGSALAAPPIDRNACVLCHPAEAARVDATGGHAPVLDCASCHAEGRVGRIGPGHRKIARCGDCHDSPVGHPEHASHKRGRRATRNCLACHDPHGSPNLHLVGTTISWRRRVTNVTFTSEAGAMPGGFTDPVTPGVGLCELCHRTTDFYTRTGKGKPHYTDRCTDCHDHARAFAPVATEQNCILCHEKVVALHDKPSGHAPLACSTCHAEVNPTPGMGHRAAEACETCHADIATHAPPGRAPFVCVQCHDPHGSDNVQLVRETLTTPAGAMVSIGFDKPFGEGGRVDGAFASVTKPGTGICEVCHTQTAHYRSDGTSPDPHYAFSCLPCHPHANGFAPQPQ